MPAVISDKDEDEEDGQAVITDTAFGELRDHVIVSGQLRYESYNLCHLDPVVQTMDSAICCINHYPVDK